jgi:hypothetical protein
MDRMEAKPWQFRQMSRSRDAKTVASSKGIWAYRRHDERRRDAPLPLERYKIDDWDQMIDVNIKEFYAASHGASP